MHLLNWNIRAGGYEHYGDSAPNAERLQAIDDTVRSARQQLGITATTLTDANKWDVWFGGAADRQLELPHAAQHLGFQSAYFTRLHDKRLEADDGAGIGILFATDEKVDYAAPIELGNRDGLLTMLDIGKYGLQLAHVYLDDLDENVRITQWHSLIGQLEKDVPTAIVGDLNALRPDLRGAALRHRAGDMAVRCAARLLSASSYIGKSVRGMNQRRLIPITEACGFKDADPSKRPTATNKLPIFGLDYVLHNKRVAASNFRVLSNPTVRRASDHAASTVELAA